MEGAQTQQAHHLRGSGARGVQNHRRARLGALQLFEQAGRGIAQSTPAAGLPARHRNPGREEAPGLPRELLAVTVEERRMLPTVFPTAISPSCSAMQRTRGVSLKRRARLAGLRMGVYLQCFSIGTSGDRLYRKMSLTPEMGGCSAGDVAVATAPILPVHYTRTYERYRAHVAPAFRRRPGNLRQRSNMKWSANIAAWN